MTKYGFAGIGLYVPDPTGYQTFVELYRNLKYVFCSPLHDMVFLVITKL